MNVFFSFLAQHILTLQMEAVGSFETSLKYWTTQRHIPNIHVSFEDPSANVEVQIVFWSVTPCTLIR
jgi:hypothetical protein